MNLDIQLFRAINGLAGNNPVLDGIGIFLARDLIYFQAVLLFLILLWMARRGDLLRARKLLLLALFSVVISFALSATFGHVRYRQRPYGVQPGATNLIGNPGLGRSFPSGHATVAFALAFATAFVLPAWTIPMILIALLVGFGRVFVGVHYPLDILGGAVLSFVVTWLIERVSRYKSQYPNPKSQ